MSSTVLIYREPLGLSAPLCAGPWLHCDLWSLVRPFAVTDYFGAVLSGSLPLYGLSLPTERRVYFVKITPEKKSDRVLRRPYCSLGNYHLINT